MDKSYKLHCNNEMNNSIKLIVHYFHFENQWFYFVNEYENSSYRKQSFNLNHIPYTKFADDVTHKEAKEKLLDIFPDCSLHRAKPYHYSPRNKNSNGSRIYKQGHNKEDKKNIRKMKRNTLA